MLSETSFRTVYCCSRRCPVKRCSRPGSRPTTRTFLPFDSKESAMIEPVFPLAPKITYMAFKATGEIIASASFIC
jgi:hypothetical protein